VARPGDLPSPGAGGRIDLVGQISGTGDSGFTFLAPTMLVNVPGLPSISTGGGGVNFGSTTAGIAITLQSDLDVETIGGNITQIGTIDGNNDLVFDAGFGVATINGNLSPVPSGTSIGGSVALASVDITAGLMVLRPNIQTTGDQSYSAIEIQMYSGNFSATMTGAISFSGVVNVANSVGVFTKGGDISFNGTIDNIADPATPAGKGSLLLNAQTGDITFTGDVGNSTSLRSFEVGGANSLTVNDDMTIFGYFKVKSDEVDLLGGDNSVTVGGAIEFHPSTSITQIEIGGAETGTANSLSLSEDDISALTDGAVSILVSPQSGNQPITIVGTATFHDPTTITTNTKTGGDLFVNAELTGDTANGGFTLKAPNVRLDANLTTTGGGAIDISNGVLMGDVVLDTSVGGGDVTLRDKFVASVGGEDLTINAGAGDITILSRLSDKGQGALLGAVTLASTGITTIKQGGYAESLLIDGTDGGGTTLLGGRFQTHGSAGQTYGDAVVLTSGVTLVSTNATGVIHFEDAVDSQASKNRSLSIINRNAALATEVVTFDAGADVGLAWAASSATSTSRRAATFPSAAT
jgi:hypothetical protein